tara:strand:+ start:776 stop:1060 length:285 start_codon:yes stop_codon:yes gene_type:complete
MYKPYKEEILEKHGTRETYRVREFDENLEDRELIWHRDEETRRVTVLAGVGWQFQLDDELPRELIIGQHFSIPRLKYHRVIKGKGNLIVKIENI